MMATSWPTVRANAIAAAEGVLLGSWSAASAGATGQIYALVHVAQYISDNRAKLTKPEINFLMDQQKTALQNVLTTYESIGIAAAINTVNAVMQVVVQAAPTLFHL
jgi:hypothetical protein